MGKRAELATGVRRIGCLLSGDTLLCYIVIAVSNKHKTTFRLVDLDSSDVARLVFREGVTPADSQP